MIGSCVACGGQDTTTTLAIGTVDVASEPALTFHQDVSPIFDAK
ncbi:MAG TPA: hypothetical protein VNN80_01975 [Polyangiaceae bacterium]|nr:hypothetical protein [Polyangiaceae bacterium]